MHRQEFPERSRIRLHDVQLRAFPASRAPCTPRLREQVDTRLAPSAMACWIDKPKATSPRLCRMVPALPDLVVECSSLSVEGVDSGRRRSTYPQNKQASQPR
jgi:hypothetical protein